MKKTWQKIAEYGFYLLIFLLPWQTRLIWHQGYLAGGPWEYSSFSLYGIDILIVLLLLSSFLVKHREVKSVKNIWLLVLAFLFISFLSIFDAKNQELGWYAFARLLEGVALLWIILKLSFSWTKLGVAVVAAAFIQSGLAIYQFFSQSSPAFKWLGLASQDPGVLGTFVVGTSAGRFLRAYGSLPHPNMLGGFLAVALIILIGLYFSLYQNKNAKLFLFKDILIIISLAVIMFGLLLTFARSSWLALAVSLIILLAVNIFRKNKLQLWLSLKTMTAILLVAVFAVLLIPQPFKTRAAGQERLEVKSSQERLAYYADAKNLLEKSWLRGVGIGNYTQAVYDQVDSSRESWDYQPVHNIFLLIAAETGVFGLIIFLLLIFEILKNFLGQFKKSGSWFLIYFVIFISLLLIGFFDHYFWSLAFGIWLFWLVVGLQLKAGSEV